MDYGKRENTALRIAVFLVKVLFVACLSAMAKGLILLASLKLTGAFVWFFGGFYILCVTAVMLILLTQR